MAQFKERSNQAQDIMRDCAASQMTEVSVPLFIPKANISDMVPAQQQSTIENLVDTVGHEGSASMQIDDEDDDYDDDDDSSEIGSPRFAEPIAGHSTDQVVSGSQDNGRQQDGATDREDRQEDPLCSGTDSVSSLYIVFLKVSA